MEPFPAPAGNGSTEPLFKGRTRLPLRPLWIIETPPIGHASRYAVSNTHPIGLPQVIESVSRSKGMSAPDKSPCAATRYAPQLVGLSSPTKVPPPLHTAEYSGRLLSGWRRSALSPLSASLLGSLRPRLAALWSGCLAKHSRPSTASLFCGRRQAGGLECVEARLFGRVTIVLASLRAIERVQNRTRTTLSCGRRPNRAAKPHW